MSLDWNCRNVRDWEDLNADEQEGWKTQALCFELMRCGWSGTVKDEADAKALWKRVRVAQKVWGTIATWDGEPLAFNEQDIIRRVGYSTNVGPKWTDTQFAKALMEE
jgi:hypothetical protein